MPRNDAKILVVMGPSGSGKSSLASALSSRLGWPLLDADDLHAAESIARMASGSPLTDEDRQPWLERVAAWISARAAVGGGGVVACSALRRCYRDQLSAPGVVFVYMAASPELLERRLARRAGHFVGPSLLGSQLAILEPPGTDERAITIDAALPLDEQCRLLAEEVLGAQAPEESTTRDRKGAAVQVGMVGMGRMGAGMAQRLRRAGHSVVGYDRSEHAPRDVESLEELVAALQPPRTVWLMVPAGEATRDALRALVPMLSRDDVVVDGGNSRYTDDLLHAEMLAEHGIGYVDAGISGGIHGTEAGYGVMVGGDAGSVAALQPVFDALAPADGGFVHAGPIGAGHFAKMVHNGVEYGLMHAYGEGFELLEASELIQDPAAVLSAWRHGTVVRSWLLDLLVQALAEDPHLEAVRGYAHDSGEARWMLQAALECEVPVPVTSAALFARFSSRQQESPAMQAVAALRLKFGGHAVVPRGDDALPEKR